MPTKSIIEIDVNDARFQAFKKLHDAYTASLKAAPAAWAAANAQMAVGERGMRRQVSVARQLAGELQGVGRELRSIASLLRDMGGTVLRWGGIGGLLGGLLGLGGLFGIDALAQGAAGQRRRALGLGTGFGGLQGFGAFNRFVGGDFLERVAGGRFDLTQRVGLLGAGLTAGQIDSGDTAATGAALLRNLKRIADSTDPRLFGQVIQARRLPTTVEELERLRNTKPAEFNRQMALAAQQQRQLQIDDKILLQWQNLVTTLDFAGKNINKVLVVGLAGLATPLGKLSASVTDVVASFLDAATKRGWIEGLGNALEKFAKYVATPEFDSDVKKFVDNIAAVANAVGRAAAWFSSWFGHQARPNDALRTQAAGRLHARQQHTAARINSALSTGFNILTGGLFSSDQTGRRQMNQDQLLAIVRQSEGSGDAAVSPKGAIGRFQVMPETGRAFGASPDQLRDPKVSEMVARRLLAQLIRKYHGDTDKVLAAYNMGETKFDQVLAGRRTLPLETQKYVTGAHSMTGYSPTVIEVNNNTGGNVTVSANGLKN